MRLALLIGNRFNPWHFQGYRHLRGEPQVTVFRAESEIQQYFDERDDRTLPFAFKRMYFDTQAGNPIKRALNVCAESLLNREPRILPFHERLRGYDVIQSWELFTDWSAQAVLAREKYGVPLAVMVWDNIPFNMERSPGRRGIKERVAKGADIFIVHTERSRRMLDFEGVPPGRVVKISPGVDTELFSPGSSEHEGFNILFVGWFLPRKGLDFLLFALRELLNDRASRSQDIRLIMAGSGPGRDRIDASVQRLDLGDVCVFRGAVPHGTMPNVYRAADLFVLPSIAAPEWQEQFGMSLIEAMACGTPVITTRTGAIPEIVGESAILCQPNDFASLADALKQLVQDPARREELSQSGRARVLEHFTLKKHAEALSDIYESLLGTR